MIGSGLAAKVLIGAAAVAAVGGAVASEPPSPPVDPSPATTPTVGPPTAAPAAVEATTPGVVPAEQTDQVDTPFEGSVPDPVATYLAAVNEWTACIDLAVHEFAASGASRQGFDPFAECPDKPSPHAFGLGKAYGRPDHAGRPDDPGSQSEDAPGRPDVSGPPQGAGRSSND